MGWADWRFWTGIRGSCDTTFWKSYLVLFDNEYRIKLFIDNDITGKKAKVYLSLIVNSFEVWWIREIRHCLWGIFIIMILILWNRCVDVKLSLNHIVYFCTLLNQSNVIKFFWRSYKGRYFNKIQKRTYRHCR